MIQRDVITDFSGFPDNHPHPVIDEKSFADTRARMNFNTGQKAAEMGHHSGRNTPVIAPEPAGDSVRDNRMKTGITRHDFQCRTGSRVTRHYSTDFFTKRFKHRLPSLCYKKRHLHNAILLKTKYMLPLSTVKISELLFSFSNNDLT